MMIPALPASFSFDRLTTLLSGLFVGFFLREALTKARSGEIEACIRTLFFSSNRNRSKDKAKKLLPADVQLRLAKQKVEKLRLGAGRYHVMVCAPDAAGADKCCDRAESQKTFDYLKKRLKELRLSTDAIEVESIPTSDSGEGLTSNMEDTSLGCVLRSKVSCLRVCSAGPIVCVQPGNVMYARVTEEVMEDIIQRHLIGGNVVEEHRIG